MQNFFQCFKSIDSTIQVWKVKSKQSLIPETKEQPKEQVIDGKGPEFLWLLSGASEELRVLHILGLKSEKMILIKRCYFTN